MMNRWFLSLVLILAVGAVLCAVFFKTDGEDRLNILLITLDTTRADRLGCYGHEGAVTPRMDEMARQGIRFDLAIAQAAITPVSHASILTGLYPFQHGLRVIHGANSFRLEEGSHPTLPGLLRDHGWHTAAFVSAFTASEYFGLDHGFDFFDTGLSGNVEGMMEITEEGHADWAMDRNQRRADAATDSALSWLERNREPFFLWLHYFDPHDLTLLPPSTFLEPFITGVVDQVDFQRRAYDGEVAFMDAQLGRIFDFLEARGDLDNTLIVITNDHGEGLGDHDWWFHRILYQEQIRMPLIVRLPGGPEKRVVPDLVRSIDIMPTLLEAAGVPIPPMAGRSLGPLIRGEPEPERIAYADALIRLDDNRSQLDRERYDDLMYCVMTRSWKMIHRHFNPSASELYHLEADPEEGENLFSKEPDKVEYFMKFLNRPGVMIEKLIPPGPEDEAANRLKDLGY